MAALALSDSDDSDTKMLFAAFQGLDQPPGVRVGDETRDSEDTFTGHPCFRSKQAPNGHT